jgi:N-carbamoylputrescine amidase
VLTLVHNTLTTYRIKEKDKKLTKVAYVEWQDGLIPTGSEWEKIAEQVNNSKADILVTNEMPFGAWRPVDAAYDVKDASLWAEEHECNIDALNQLDVPTVISSRPIVIGDRLVNEAFALENNQYQVLHHKHFFPSEDGWHEASWFKKEIGGFSVSQVGNLKVGILLCTELMFTEQARYYGRSDADLIISPRASGCNRVIWRAACAMAAVVSGAYVISSNRVGASMQHIPEFGGYGLAYGPGGEKIDNTTSSETLKTIDVDVELSKRMKSNYPCYLRY